MEISFTSPGWLKEDKLNVVLDWLACGIDPNKSTIY